MIGYRRAQEAIGPLLGELERPGKDHRHLGVVNLSQMQPVAVDLERRARVAAGVDGQQQSRLAHRFQLKLADHVEKSGNYAVREDIGGPEGVQLTEPVYTEARVSSRKRSYGVRPFRAP